jgi:hypothetical protein
MQQTKLNNKIDNYCNELELLSSKMAELLDVGNYSAIESIDLKRKLILKEISKDVSSLSNNNKNKIQLVWVNNKNMMEVLNERLEDKKKKFIKKKKLFKAYTFDN